MRRALILVGLVTLACGGTQSTDAVRSDSTPLSGGAGEAPVTHAGDAGQPGVVSAGAGGDSAGAAGDSASAGAGGESVGGLPGYGGEPHSGGNQSGGTGGEAGGPPDGPSDVDECKRPTNENYLDCDGLCRGANPVCSACSLATADGYVELSANSPRSCGPCSDATIGLKVKAMTCARFSAQPGTSVSFMTENCSSTHEQCMIATGLDEGTGVEKVVWVGRPSQNAWVHQQTADLVLGKCPLACP